MIGQLQGALDSFNPNRTTNLITMLCVPLALKIFQHSSAFSSHNSYLLKFHYCLARTIDSHSFHRYRFERYHRLHCRCVVSKTPLALPGDVVMSPLLRSRVLRIIPSRKDAPLAALLSYNSRALLMSCPDKGLAIGLGALEEFVVVLPTPAPPTGTFPTALAVS
uniref:Uncharacterized protein n=1 Tax=Glossina pallidipes TaxID=7398 RepID=A0A1B0A247_GLOPL